jgi:choline dehydrogenase-like flavoprotein
LTYQVGRGLTASTAAILTPWGTRHREVFGRFFNHEVLMNVQAEDLPIYENRVELDGNALDSSGLPGVKVRYKLHANDRAIVEFGIERARELADAAGAMEFLSPGVVSPNPAWHLLGTCRMGSDPQTSVTDSVHQTWDVPNLYICDGSSFVTDGSVNPTSTIGALALRCADRILDRDDIRS